MKFFIRVFVTIDDYFMTTAKSPPPISDEVSRRIEESLRTWSDPDSAARKRFEAAGPKWEQALQPIEDAIVASERLTEADFAFRINTRD